MSFSSFWGSQVIVGQMGFMLPACSRSHPRRTCPEKLQRETSRIHPNQTPEPPHLAPFNTKEQWLYSELLTLSLRLSPATLPGKVIPAACIHDFILWVMTHRWGLDKDQLVNQELFLLAQLLPHHDGLAQHPHYLLQRTKSPVCLPP